MMAETARFNGGIDTIELEFVEREATPGFSMQLGIRVHLAGLSISNTVRLHAILGVDGC
jgi:hypothetical protein